MSNNPISETAILFIKKCSEIIGQYEAEKFIVNTSFDCKQIEHFNSPIEHILFTALTTVRRIDNHNQGDFVAGPQWQIGKYRVDFFIVYKGSKTPKGIIVECDSQEFHERTEKERRYEKRRDRYLQSCGYNIFHYTGKEILEDPFTIAREIFSHLTLEDPFTIAREIFSHLTLEDKGNNYTHEMV